MAVLTVAASGPDTEGGVVGPDPGGRRPPPPRPQRQGISLINHYVLLFFNFNCVIIGVGVVIVIITCCVHVMYLGIVFFVF